MIKTENLNKKQIVYWIITIVGSLLPLFISVNDSYTSQIQKFLVFTIFAVLTLCFELLDGAAISLITCSGWVLTGVCTYAQAFSGWASSTCMMLICSLVLVQILLRQGLLNRIGYKALLLVKGDFRKLMWGLFLASILILTVGFVLSAPLCFTLAYAIYAALGFNNTDKETYVLVGTMILSALTAQTFLYCPLAVGVFDTAVQAVIDYKITFMEILKWNWPSIIFVFLCEWGLLFWYKKTSKNNVDVTATYNEFSKKYNDMGKMSSGEKKGAITLIIAAVILLTQEFTGLDSAYAFIFAVIFCFLPGINIAAFEDFAKIPWSNNIFVVLTFLAIGTVGSTIGLSKLLSSFCLPLVSKMGAYWSVLGTLLLGTGINFVLSPFAMLAMLPSIIGGYCLEVGYDIIPHLYAMYQARDFIFLPYEWPAALVLFSFGMIKMSGMIKLLTIKTLAAIVFFIAVLMPYWHFVL